MRNLIKIKWTKWKKKGLLLGVEEVKDALLKECSGVKDALLKDAPLKDAPLKDALLKDADLILIVTSNIGYY
jgi:hypothetical protein